MSVKKKETVPNSSVGADVEQPLSKTNKSIITNANEQRNRQAIKYPEKSRKQGQTKNIQISENLFVTLIKYHLIGIEDVLPDITRGLELKLNALVKHQLYSQYKTAFTEEEREKARKEYLDKVKLHNDFRW